MDLLLRIRNDHRHSDRSLLYLACPYTHENDEVEAARYWGAGATALRLQHEHNIYEAFSPINHPLGLPSHQDKVNVPKHFDAWEAIDKTWLDSSYALCVLIFNGWMESVGVNAEMEYADGTIPIFALNPITLTTYRDPKDAPTVAPGDVPGLLGNDEDEKR